MNRVTFGAVIGAALFAIACGGSESAQSADTTKAAPAEAAAPAGPQTPDPGGRVDTIGMYTDAAGNYFKPKQLTVHQGDVVRFVLGSGVHNAAFTVDSNPGAKGLPQASQYLQLPGQAYDVKVDFKPGSYYFQCDAHAALGMTGRLTVLAK
jgi:plastocyanin